MAAKDATTIIVIADGKGRIISINYGYTVAMGDSVKYYLDEVISQMGYDIKSVSHFLTWFGWRTQYTLVKLARVKARD